MYVFNTNREIHPEGLPPSYTIILLFRLLPDTTTEPFDIWQIADKNNNPEVGVTINRKPSILFLLSAGGESCCNWLTLFHCFEFDPDFWSFYFKIENLQF